MKKAILIISVLGAFSSFAQKQYWYDNAVTPNVITNNSTAYGFVDYCVGKYPSTNYNTGQSNNGWQWYSEPEQACPGTAGAPCWGNTFNEGTGYYTFTPVDNVSSYIDFEATGDTIKGNANPGYMFVFRKAGSNAASLDLSSKTQLRLNLASEYPVTLTVELNSANNGYGTVIASEDIVLPGTAVNAEYLVFSSPVNSATDVQSIVIKVKSGSILPTGKSIRLSRIEGGNYPSTNSDAAISTSGLVAGTTSALVSEATKIYPNPSEKDVTVSLEVNRTCEAELKILNSIGDNVIYRKLGVISVGGHTSTFEFNEVVEGVYFVQYILDGQLVRTDKLIIQ